MISWLELTRKPLIEYKSRRRITPTLACEAWAQKPSYEQARLLLSLLRHQKSHYQLTYRQWSAFQKILGRTIRTKRDPLDE